MLFAEGIDERTVAALRSVRRPWMQMRWAVGIEKTGETTLDTARMELWWSRRIPNWGGYMATDADWRWRTRTRSRRVVDATLLAMAREVAECRLPTRRQANLEATWLGELLRTLLADGTVLGEAEWFEVLLMRDSPGWTVTARREYLSLGSQSARTLGAVLRRVDANRRLLVSGAGIEGLAELRAAMARATGKKPWSQLDDEQRRELLGVYAIRPSTRLAAGDPV